jgi:hypothetical protein
MGLRDSLTPEQSEVLSEVLKDALDQAKETLRLHEADDFGWYNHVHESLSSTAEAYLAMVALQARRIAVIKELSAMMERPSG